MLNQQTIEKLYTMRMRGMADALTQQQEDPQSGRRFARSDRTGFPCAIWMGRAFQCGTGCGGWKANPSP